MSRKKTTLLGLLVWVVITFIFSEFHSASDGTDHIGFPFYFYSYFSGKSDDPLAYGIKIDFIKLFADLLIAAAFIIVFNMLSQKVSKPYKTNPDL
ncbi:hypothetical protein [Mucilaginibacter pedocola]|uniref:Uncharacterized protein n=1 Tax=Mucilaginibacter pedocola TaxID=1792845 RepID=A0A1S9PGR6_9SPHI|nr:hypothetical protein [Mucilaginibacter pedocola]OOQ60097.1 hypothetical protein BC343_26595 [Mucilaginibacter pedocola]